ncbi:MAG: PD-(D/E)XK nuclease family protein [Candidatus Sericytochromatia bacterium]|nr:PD-(D/E)XK nuclease family protein [Candidatus Sericytochromatia bacterium]
MHPPRSYSPSLLGVYQRCPRRYYHQYVVRVPRRTHDSQVVGINLHGALEVFYRQGGFRTGSPATAIAQLESAWADTDFSSPEASAAARRDAVTMLAAYLDAEAAAPPGETLMVEQRLKATVEGIPLRGIVDRVDRQANGELVLVDYKSGHSDAQGLPPGTLLQLAVYRQLIARSALGQPPDRVVLASLRGGNRDIMLSAQAWDEALQQALDLARQLAADDDFVARPAASCVFCDYQHRCVPWLQTTAAELPGAEGPVVTAEAPSQS